MFERHGGGGCEVPPARYPNDNMTDMEERRELAAQKFDEWVRFKDCFERGVGLFAKLDPRHCLTEESWQRVAVALAAIDRSLGIDLKGSMSIARRSESPQAKTGPKSMFDVFKKWSMAHHTFTSIKLTSAEVSSLSPATLQFLEEEEGNKATKVIPSLKYHFPPPPARRGLRTRPMTEDQKATNAIFMRRVRAGWLGANYEMREQLAVLIEDSETMYQAKRLTDLGKRSSTATEGMQVSDAVDAAKVDLTSADEETKGEGKEQNEQKEELKSEEENKADDESKSQQQDRVDRNARIDRSAISDGDDCESMSADGRETSRYSQVMENDDEGAQQRKIRFMDAGLAALGIRRLRGFLEEDEDNRTKKANDDRLEREEEARRAHEGWVRVKDTRRFRVPDEQAFRQSRAWKPPRFDFSGGKGLVRPNKNLIASTTLDIMRGQGMKYVHAISDARQGVEGDLEKSRRQIRRYKETVVQDRRRRAAERHSEKIKAFRKWSQLKEITEEAVKCLRNVDPPKEPVVTRAARDRWLEVGRALKSVDARLLTEWISWTGQSFPTAHCKSVWDALPPRACDTHTTSYSAIRETLLKLLRPGVDYRDAFHKVVRRRLRRAGAEGGPRFDERDELDEADLVLNRRELGYLLSKELGIVMQKEEMRRLVDAFDSNEGKLIRWKDFEDLTGGVREAARGDTAKRLKRRCVWETTCPVTGMPNAFTVSAVKAETREAVDVITERERYSDDEEDRIRPRSSGKTITTTTRRGAREIIILRNGDRRQRDELAERAKRLRILRRYNLAPPAEGHRGSAGDKGGDYDEDAFEGDDSYDEDDFERSEGGGPNVRGIDHHCSPNPGKGHGDHLGGGKVPCEASEWPMSKRTLGLKMLKRFSKGNREANELRQLLAEGVAPKPPQFWSAKSDHPDVGEEEDVLMHELLLCWRPQPGTAVAFFSLEMSGPEGSKSFCQGSYREICRDPPDADGEPEYQFWVQGLSPNTRYGFRVRAFNGFGHGGYAHGCFATRPAEPARPVAIRVAPTEICLRWIFGDRNAAKVRELRQVFDSLEDHGNGEVSREELLEILYSEHPYLLEVLKASPTVGTSSLVDNAQNWVRETEGRRNAKSRKGDEKCRDGQGAVRSEMISVFDEIEANDDEFIRWDEIERHFGHVSCSGGVDGGGEVGRVVAQGGRSKAKVHFVLEMCLSEEDHRWKEAWKGTGGTAKLKMLEPAHGYRFRVRGVNCEGLAGPVSESVVVNTLLVTPAMPRLHGGSSKTNPGVWDTRVRLRWDAPTERTQGTACPGLEGALAVGAGGGTTSAADRMATKILRQWAKNSAEDEGVSLERIFSQLDRDGSGYIDSLEERSSLCLQPQMLQLGKLLENLGMEVTEERLREAFSELDHGGKGIDGIVSLQDFEAWWTSGAITFTLARDNGVDGNALELETVQSNSLSAGAETTTVASYKGRGTSCEVAGLSPNTMYQFRLRTMNAKTRSPLSAPLEVMTAPRRLEPPVIIRSHRNAVVLKWYPGPGGAYKYHLQSRAIEGLGEGGAVADINWAGSGGDGVGGVYRRRKAWSEGGEGSGGWVTMYEGVDSTAKVMGLAANSAYRFRVRASNVRGVASEWSLPTQAATAQRKGCGLTCNKTSALVHRPECAAEVFQVDADDDIVVGDTIIFTERLYVDRDGKLFQGLGGSGAPLTSSPQDRFSTPPAAPTRVSIASLGSDGGERWASSARRLGTPITKSGTTGEFAGERTAAARVLQDSFRVIKRRETGGVLEYNRSTSRQRLLRLEIIWSTVSTEEAETFVLSPGSVVERSQARLSQFETFRALWEQDERRKTVRQEWALLSGQG